MSVYMTVRNDCLYIKDDYVDDLDNSIRIYHPLLKENEVIVALQDGAAFYVSKRTHLEKTDHQYWQFFNTIPPLEYCTKEFAGNKHSDEVWCAAHLKRVIIDGEDLIPPRK